MVHSLCAYKSLSDYRSTYMDCKVHWVIFALCFGFLGLFFAPTSANQIAQS